MNNDKAAVKNAKIILALDYQMVQLEHIAKTINALTLAFEESSVDLDGESLRAPNEILWNTVKKIKKMYDTIDLNAGVKTEKTIGQILYEARRNDK